MFIEILKLLFYFSQHLKADCITFLMSLIQELFLPQRSVVHPGSSFSCTYLTLENMDVYKKAFNFSYFSHKVILNHRSKYIQDILFLQN